MLTFARSVWVLFVGVGRVYAEGLDPTTETAIRTDAWVMYSMAMCTLCAIMGFYLKRVRFQNRSTASDPSLERYREEGYEEIGEKRT